MDIYAGEYYRDIVVGKMSNDLTLGKFFGFCCLFGGILSVIIGIPMGGGIFLVSSQILVIILIVVGIILILAGRYVIQNEN